MGIGARDAIASKNLPGKPQVGVCLIILFLLLSNLEFESLSKRQRVSLGDLYTSIPLWPLRFQQAK